MPIHCRLSLLKTAGACCLVAALLAGCAQPGPKFNPHLRSAARTLDLEPVSLADRIDPTWLRQPTNAFRLGPGDKLEIELLGDPASRTQAVVGPDGMVYFHLLRGIDVWGLTLAEAKTRIEQGLGEFLKDNPVVLITLREVESQRVWLLGRLHTPGVYSLSTPMTLLEAIAMAGGTLSSTGMRDAPETITGQEVADLRRAFVMRKGQVLPIDFNRLLRGGDISQNVYLQPDDFLYFPSAVAREVYILGAVATPRSVPYSDRTTLISAVAGANGTIPEAYLHHVAIVRGSLTEPRVAIVDYKAIATGQMPNVPLEPGDIVYVPFKPYRYLSRYADLVVKTFVSSIAINEGARAVTPTASTTGVFIPVGGGGGGTTPVTPVR